MNYKEFAQNWLKSLTEDPIAKLIAKNSNLTRIQLETLLIDVLAENLASKRLKYEEKAKLRPTKAAITRGSFNRTLRQAKTNIIHSIFTILLLGYFGIFDESNLSGYVDAGKRIREYMEVRRNLLNHKSKSEEQLEIARMLHEELESTLHQLSKPWSSNKQ